MSVQAGSPEAAAAPDSLESSPQKKGSILDKKDEAPQLRDEIVQQIQLQQPLFLAMITGCAVLLYQALQPGVSALTACLVPRVGLSLALKISGHDLRAGQIGFYQRKFLRSPWEMVRRLLWSGKTLTHTSLSKGLRLPLSCSKKLESWHPLSLTTTGQTYHVCLLRGHVRGDPRHPNVPSVPWP